MSKRPDRFPVTVAFRTTVELKKKLMKVARSEGWSTSELLQVIVDDYAHWNFDLSPEYTALVKEKAILLGRDHDWMRRKIMSHRRMLVWDAHHGYDERSAIEDLRESIESHREAIEARKHANK